MPYRIKNSGLGFYQGEVIEDAVFKAHPFHQKMLGNGSAVQVAEGDSAVRRSDEEQSRLNELEKQINALKAEQARISGAEPTSQTVELPEPGAAADPLHQAAVRAAGREVIQPTSGDPVVGEVVDEQPDGAVQSSAAVQAMESSAREKARAAAAEVRNAPGPSVTTPQSPGEPPARKR